MIRNSCSIFFPSSDPIHSPFFPMYLPCSKFLVPFFVFPQHGTVVVSRNIMAGPALITEEWLDLEQHVSQALKLEEAQVSGRVAGDFAQKVAKFGPRNEEIKLRMIRIGIQNSLKKWSAKSLRISGHHFPEHPAFLVQAVPAFCSLLEAEIKKVRLEGSSAQHMDWLQWVHWDFAIQNGGISHGETMMIWWFQICLVLVILKPTFRKHKKQTMNIHGFRWEMICPRRTFQVCFPYVYRKLGVAIRSISNVAQWINPLSSRTI